MNKEQIINVIKKYLSDKFECDISDLDKKGLNIVKNKQNSKLKMLLFYDLILVSSSENMYDYVCEKLKDKNTYEVFEFPLVYGQSIYFIPNLNKICTFIFKNIFTEEKISYATGFSSGLIIVGMIIFIRTIFAISGVDKGKKLILC